MRTYTTKARRKALYVYDAPHCRVKVLQGDRGPTLTIRRANGDYVKLDEEITDLIGIAIRQGIDHLTARHTEHPND